MATDTKQILQALLSHITQDSDVKSIINLMFETNPETINEHQKTAIITLLSQNIENSINPELLHAIATKFLSYSSNPNLQSTKPTIDVCGTGGDGKNTLNISTAVSFLLAFSGYFTVVKHGNVGVSSKSGSADIFRTLNFDLSPQAQQDNVNKHNLAFLFAPYYNSGFANFAQIRKSLGIKTIFNLLGPLLNPTRPEISMIGVFTNDLQNYAKTLSILNVKHFSVIKAQDGTDEISAIYKTNVCIKQGNKLSNITIEPADFGINQKYNIKQITGGDPKHNAKQMLALFSQQQFCSKLNCFKDFVLANAAFALYTANIDSDLKNCYKICSQVHQKILQDDLFKFN